MLQERNRKKKSKQGFKTIREQHPDGVYPVGEMIVNKEIMHGADNESEQNARDATYWDRLNDLRAAGKAHVQVIFYQSK